MAKPVYHEGMLRGSIAAVLTGALLSGCASEVAPTLGFPPGEYEASSEGVTVMLLSATYDSNRVQLECSIRNSTDRPVTVGRSGLLLADGDLEVPLADEGTPVPSQFVIEPDAEQPLTLRFPVHGLSPTPRMLRLRAVWSGETPLKVISVRVPGIRTTEVAS